MAGAIQPLYRNINDLDTTQYYSHTWPNPLPTIEALGWTNEGHLFKEWNGHRDGTGYAYQPGEVTDNESGLYAIWEEDSDPILTTTYGSTTNNITSYGTFTLDTKGKFCQNDIVLSFDGEGE